MFKSKKDFQEESSTSYIIIIEDDPEQMSLLSNFARSALHEISSSENIEDDQRQKIKEIKLITATNIHALEQAVQIHKNVLLAILDCNIPDNNGGQPHDQFVKTNYKITGQHKAVDIVTKHLPSTPITMISSMNRFQKIVTQYYENKHNLNINFIRKSDFNIIKKNIGYYLRKHIN